MSARDEARAALLVDDHAFQGVITKLRTTKGSPYALDVMAEAAGRIEAIIAALRALLEEPVPADEREAPITDAQVEAAAAALYEHGWHETRSPACRAEERAAWARVFELSDQIAQDGLQAFLARRKAAPDA